MKHFKLILALFIYAATMNTASAVDIEFSDYTYSYNPSTGIITDLTFTINEKGGQGTPGFDVHINVLNTADNMVTWVAGKNGQGGIGGGGNRTYTFAEIDLKTITSLPTGSYRLAVYIPQFQTNIYLLWPPSQTLSYTKTTSAIAEASSSEFKLYPNPVSSSAFIEIDVKNTTGFQLRVFDMKGQEVFAERIGAGIQQIRLDCSGLKEGVYMCTAQIGESVLNRRILKL